MNPYVQFSGIAAIVILGIAVCTAANSIHEDRVKADLLSQGMSGSEIMCALRPPVDSLERAVICGKLEIEE